MGTPSEICTLRHWTKVRTQLQPPGISYRKRIGIFCVRLETVEHLKTMGYPLLFVVNVFALGDLGAARGRRRR